MGIGDCLGVFWALGWDRIGRSMECIWLALGKKDRKNGTWEKAFFSRDGALDRSVWNVSMTGQGSVDTRGLFTHADMTALGQ